MGHNRSLKHLYIYSQLSFHMAFFCTQLKWLNMCCNLFNCGFNTQSQKGPNCFNELIFVTSIISSWIPLPQKYNYDNCNNKKTIGCLLKCSSKMSTSFYYALANLIYILKKNYKLHPSYDSLSAVVQLSLKDFITFSFHGLIYKSIEDRYIWFLFFHMMNV